MYIRSYSTLFSRESVTAISPTYNIMTYSVKPSLLPVLLLCVEYAVIQYRSNILVIYRSYIDSLILIQLYHCILTENYIVYMLIHV